MASNFNPWSLGPLLMVLLWWGLAAVPEIQGAKIVFIAFTESKSILIFKEPLILEMANRGHNVTVVSMIPWTKSHPNIRVVKTPNWFDLEAFTTITEDSAKAKQDGTDWKFYFDFAQGSIALCDMYLQTPEVEALKDEHFDLAVSTYSMNECTLGLLNRWKAPFALIHANEVHPNQNPTGLPYPASHLPMPFLGFSDDMTFSQRVVNFVVGLGLQSYDVFYRIPATDKVIRKYYPEFPSIHQFSSQVSLVMANSDPILTFPRPLMPDVIEVAGMHIRPAEKLPNDLETFVEGSGNEGFIVFSMGSVLSGSRMPAHVRQAFLGAFGKLKQRVLMKWETDAVAEFPPNVKPVKWLPQQDVLGHPKCKAFISHGGLHSLEEAVYFGVPLVGMPVFYDQDSNMKLAGHHGIGVALELPGLTEDKVLAAVRKVVGDQSMQEKADKLSQLMQDKQQTPLENAVFHLEYVLRHQGAKHLRSPARNLNFFQYYSYDVMAFLAMIVFVMVYSVYFVLRAIFRRLCGQSQSQRKTKLKTH